MSTTTLLILVVVALVIRFILWLAEGGPRRPADAVQSSGRKKIVEMLDTVWMSGGVALLLVTFIVRPFYIPSESMVPTLLVNDVLLVDELAYRFWSPARGDVVVFRAPDADERLEGKDLIKRIVAVGGDTVEQRDGTVYVNGNKAEEPFRNTLDSRDIDPDFPPKKIPPGELFFMGDNRAHSNDSRFWGTLPLDHVVGKAFLIFWPPTRIGRIK